MKPIEYRRQTLALFFIVSLVPALVVAAIWYVQTRITNTVDLTVNFQSFVLPVMVLGIVPALALSLIFAELLSKPIRKIQAAVTKLTGGHFLVPADTAVGGEFGELGRGLAHLSTILERTLSETRSQSGLIAAERNKLQGVLNSMTDGVFALDAAGRIILFNRAAATLTGRTIAEVAGQLAEKVIPLRENGQLVMDRWLASERGTDHKIGQWKGLELYQAKGSSIFVDVQGVLLPDDPNGISALITFHDVSAGHELEEMKVDFVALAAHELRTPLTEVRGYLDILRQELKHPTKDQAALLDHALASADQLTGLVNNLLGVAGIEHGKINYQPVALNYRQYLNDLSATLESRAELAGRAFKLKLPTRLPNIMADPVGLHEVITNLIDNAILHTPAQNGQIVVQVRSTNSGVETTVIDNGEGIPASALPHLFTKFYRVDELKASTRGTGLGLYICRRIVEAHGGTIGVTSSPGQGSSFAFTIPAAIARSNEATDNKLTRRGAHGWIKDNSIH